MSLADLQRAIAALVCDQEALGAYRRDAASWVARRDLRGREAGVLEGLDEASLLAFHEIHARDRAYFVEAVMPLTTRRLGDGWPESYFRAHPYGLDETREEAGRFLAFLDVASRDAATPVLARLELERFLLLDSPPFDPRAPPAPVRDALKAFLVRGIAVVPSPFHLPSLEDDPTVDPAPRGAGAALLRRDVEGVTTAWVEGVEAELLAAIARGEREALRSLVATRVGREAYVDIWRQGVLA